MKKTSNGFLNIFGQKLQDKTIEAISPLWKSPPIVARSFVDSNKEKTI